MKKTTFLMGIIVGMAAVLIGLIMFTGCSVDSSDEAAAVPDYDALSASVVQLKVYAEDGSLLHRGTGFCAEREDIIFTAAHVTEGMSYAVVITDEGDTYRTECMLMSDSSADVAVLELPEELRLTPLELSAADGERGDDVFIIGSPGGMLNFITKGSVAGEIDSSGIRSLVVTAAVAEGSSGSPVFNDTGQVIGMVNGQYIDAESFVQALSAEYINSLGRNSL